MPSATEAEVEVLSSEQPALHSKISPQAVVDTAFRWMGNVQQGVVPGSQNILRLDDELHLPEFA